MQFRDIVNRDIINLTNCEFEPIHVPGSIQPHGFLIGFHKESWIIEYCSANVSEFIGLEPNQILNQSIEVVFNNTILKKIQKYIDRDLLLSTTPLKLKFKDKIFHCTVHLSGETYLIEGEYFAEKVKETDFYSQSAQFLSYMHDSHNLQELCATVANGTREITGYDRVMIYRFDKNYNGEVFAESKRDDLESFLGLHYPHTDIPIQARELYLKNLLRLIVDINYEPVPILAANAESSHKSLDLSLSILRSTSPIHVQYLQNMGVGASLTISLIHQKKLWGLIACHHYSEKNITHEIRLAAQLQGHFITSQIEVRQANEEFDVAKNVNAALERINAYAFPLDESSFEAMVSKPELLQLCNATGVAILFNDVVYKNGITPDQDYILKLGPWLAEKASLTTDMIADLLPEEIPFAEDAAGIIYHGLSADMKNAVIWFRPETIKVINWGGDPEKAIIKDENGLHPRNSFKLWREEVRFHSKPWLQSEISTASNYASSLQKHINLLLLSKEEERYRNLTEELKKTNSELENINWISTHDLQEPLRKIQLISSRILGKKDEPISDNVASSLQKMNNSANRMQTLLVDILKYTKIQHADYGFETISLQKVMAEIILEMEETINERNANIISENLPTIQGNPFLVKQLFLNLTQNSIKYSHPEIDPKITVTDLGRVPLNPSDNDQWYQGISFMDNGIGFEQQFSKNIFNIFSRLHNQDQYKGSGVGLALCKKIMQIHRGEIMAEGSPGKGATFNIYFPV